MATTNPPHTRALPPLARKATAWLALLAALAGCGDPAPRDCPATDAGSAGTTVVQDKEVQKIIDFYLVTVYSNLTRTKAQLRCTDIPGTYRPNDPSLVILQAPTKITRASKSADAEILKSFTFKVNVEMVVLAEGWATDSKGATQVVARGCADKVMFRPCQPIPAGWDKPLELDLLPTTGAPCKDANDVKSCEPGMQCINDMAGFTGGYCARTGCAGSGICPPGTECVVDTKYTGVCARKCSEMGDCKAAVTQGFLDCDFRKGGLSTSACPRTCIPSLWNTGYKCTPGSS